MSLWGFLKQLLRPYRFYFAMLIFAGLVWACYMNFSPYFIKMLIDRLPHFKPTFSCVWPAVAYVGIFLLVALNFRFIDWVKLRFYPSLKKDISLKVFDYIKCHSHTFFQDHFAGSISNKVNDMVTNVESLIQSADEFIGNILSFIISLGMMYAINPLFSLVLFVWWVSFFGVSFWISQAIHKLSKKTSESYSIYAGYLVDILGNISSVRLFSRFHYESDRLEESIDSLVLNDRSMLRYIVKMRLAQDVTLALLFAVMIYLLLHLYAKHLVTVGDFAFILMLTTSTFHTTWYLANKIVDIYRAVGKCSQAMSLMEKEHDVVDIKEAKPLQVKSGSVTFNKVMFAYKNYEPLFSNMNVCIESGSKLGLVGYSGSGKSTFINLILRLYDIQSGHILIDGQNISDVTQESLRSQISMIPQDINLFHRSLLDNIRYGDVNASDEEVIAASKKAHCHEFISQLEEGYNTLVGERGIKLSGGQRQRIAIARAFLENAPILIMDEATSSLDSVTEQYVQHSLHQAIQDRTTLVIAHRLSTLLEMDRILVFDQGKIIEDGSHQSLLKAEGRYARMWAMQSNGFLPTDQGE